MKVKMIVIMLLVVVIGISSGYGLSAAAATVNPCTTVKAGSKLLLGNDEVKPYQIAKLTVLKNTILFNANKSKIRMAKPGEKFRVYAIQFDRLDLGNGVFAANNQNIKLDIVNTKLQQLAMCVRDKNLEQAAGQMLLVKESSHDKTKATLQRFRKQSGKWVKVSQSMSAVVGKEGVGKTRESDSLTPKGTYLLGKVFGWGTKPSGMTYPFLPVGKFDYWVDSTISKDYNKYVHYTGNPYQRWKSFERLTHPLYKYAVIIRYNDAPIINGAGSAIFLHIKNSSTRYTLGCVAISEKDLLTTIKWLNPKAYPIIKIEN